MYPNGYYGQPQPVMQYPTTVQQPQYTPPQPLYGQNQMNRQSVINGRTVSSAEEITPSEVPMDGSVSIFPKSDFSEIYAKAWNSDGTMKTFRFVPCVEESPQKEEPVDMSAVILERFDKLESMLEQSTAQKTTPTSTRGQKTAANKEA